ncbi:MAG TPA: FecR family protein [Chryseolinea sp.]|nr:FecR family protein [Chryseolinea sp.]
MEQKDFFTILRKYRKGEATPAEKKLIEGWYASMGKDVYHQSIPDDSVLERRFWSTIHAHIKDSKKRDKLKMWVPRYYAGIAASILIAIVSCFFIVDNPVAVDRMTNKKKATFSWKHIANTTKISQVIVLPDKSKVALEPESKLKFSSAFNKTEREIYLEGEAFFEVTHNANLPFLVYANEVTTKVLGTSFTVKAIKNERQITVVVKTGKVSVYTRHKKENKSAPAEEIILTPNHQIIYDKKENEISKMLVEKPQSILPEEVVRRMRFEEAPVTEIFKAIEKVYGVEIVFDEAIFSSCELTTVISRDDIYSRLNIICDAIGASYTLQENRIVISSSGCKTKMY